MSKEYPSLNPIIIRRTRAHEVFLLMDRLTEQIARKNGLGKGEYIKTINGERVRFRPAADNWF